MDWTLELIVVPVTDVDRAKAFYMEKIGFELTADSSKGDSFRVVQLTPHGSACAIAIGIGIGGGAPGSLQGLQLVVSDIDAARAELTGRGAEVSDIVHFVDGAQQPGPDPDRADYNSFCFFSDPDGNSWAVQEVRSRAG